MREKETRGGKNKREKPQNMDREAESRCSNNSTGSKGRKILVFIHLCRNCWEPRGARKRQFAQSGTICPSPKHMCRGVHCGTK
uniref:Uncharacterized protein n=1 Tax=Crocodylus porosus TaxID=8502 RepID=A0A7M4FX83_CROPO